MKADGSRPAEHHVRGPCRSDAPEDPGAACERRGHRNRAGQALSVSLQAVSKHLKVLERAGLITRGRAAQWRPCRLEPRPLEDIADWLERSRRLWEGSFDRLDDHLQDIQKGRR